MYALLNFFRGTVSVSGETSGIRKIMNRMIALNRPMWGIVVSGESSSFTVKSSHLGAVKNAAAEYGLSPVLTFHGLPFFLKRYRRRPGLFIGALLGLIALYISSLYIWSIDIYGCETISVTKIEQKLEDLGVTVGKPIKSVDIRKLSNEMILAIPELSWITVNFDGTRAHVELRERVSMPPSDAYEISNMIAERDGTVVYCEALKGYSRVMRGQTVTRGQLLISGIADSRTEGYRTFNSSGKVLALTLRAEEFTVPLKLNEKDYTGNIFRSDSFRLMNIEFSPPFTQKESGFLLYDTTELSETTLLFGFIAIPLERTSVTYHEYTLRTRTLSEDEALFLARRQYLEFRRKELSGAEILSESTEHSVEGGYLTLRCKLECIENIAIEVPVTSEES